MPNASFVQTNFIAGSWSESAQARTDLEGYKTALKQSTNGYPRINGSWTRRQGFQFMANTRMGRKGRLLELEFNYQTPFQLELTNGYMRVYVGQALVYTGDNDVTVSAISTAKPAVVTVNGALPSGWANGDTIVFDFAQPMSTPSLSGRQFIAASISSTTFALYDALTGAAVDGSTLSYTSPTFGIDRVFKILEFAMPYLEDDLDDLRMVKDGSVALLLHDRYQPQAITYGSSGLAVAAQSFTDGPYLDINTTTTTLTPSASSGSITLTASSTAGINNGYGFSPADIGRLVRFQSAPAAWSSATTYANSATVLGSDNNIYQSQIGGNLNHNPTTDNGTNWVLSGDVVTWSWMTITAWTSTTVVTATVSGVTLPSTAATTSWQLGLYSNATGWPTCGTWHEGRFWLGSKFNPNRVDASVSNDVFNFSPSATDGTVGDANAIAETYNAPDNNEMYWMLTSQEGVLIGTASGEWLARASTLGDPITPTTIQIKRVSTYGCAAIDPVIAQLTTVFVQRQQRKVLDYDHYPYGETAGWYAADLTIYSSDLTVGGIAELRYQNEPNKTLWCRRADGTLIGCTFQHAPYGKESYNGWYDVAVGGSRTVNSISVGMSVDGLSETLFAVLYNSTTGYYEAVALTPMFDSSLQPYQMVFTDGTASPSGSHVMQTSLGDSFDGLRIYGLTNIAGQTVTPQILGLDLGDFTVNASGYVDVPFNTTTFTKAILEGYNNGTSYGTLALPVSTALPVSYATNAVGCYHGSTADLTDFGFWGAALDDSENWVLMAQIDGLRLYNSGTLNEIKSATLADMFGPTYSYAGFSGFSSWCYHPITKSFYSQVGSLNVRPMVRVDVATMKSVLTKGVDSSGIGGSSNSTGFQACENGMIPLSSSGSPYVVFVGYQSLIANNQITLVDAYTLEWICNYNITDAEAWLCEGFTDTGVFYALGTPKYGGAASTSWNLYKLTVNQANAFGYGLAVTSIGAIAPSAIDATWTNFSAFFGPMFDPSDGNILLFAETTDAVTNKYYWVKINSSTAAVIWTLAVANGNQPLSSVTPYAGKLAYYREYTWFELNTTAGTIATTTFTGVLNPSSPQTYWPKYDAIITPITAASTTGNTLLGTYAQANPSGWSKTWCLLTKGGPAASANWPPPSNYNYSIPATIGVNYTTYGQLLKPDWRYDAGARDGPAFGKIRRHHWYGVTVSRSATFDLGVADKEADVASGNWRPISMYAYGGQVSTGTTLFSGTISDTVDDDYSFDASIIWRVERPTPLTITAIGGYLATQDK